MTVRRTKLDVEQYDLGTLRLYREDLRAIAAAASEAGKLDIICDGFEATSPEDFDGLPEKPETVTIKAVKPDSPSSVEIRLSLGESVVQLTEPDTLLAGVVSRVRLICEPRRRHSLNFLMRIHGDGFALVPLAFLALTSSVITLAFLFSHARAPYDITFALVAVLTWGLGGFYFWAITRPWVEMINAPRADRPTYWQRTGDMWVVGVITAVLGALAGYLLGRFG